MMSPETFKHVEMFFAGSTALGLVAHAVNSFPTPENKYGQWLLGCIKFAVGQRQSAMNAMHGNDTVVYAVPQGTGNGTSTGTAVKVESTKTQVTPEAITTQTEKTVKTSTSVPNLNPPDGKE